MCQSIRENFVSRICTWAPIREVFVPRKYCNLQYTDSGSRNDLWPYWRGWPLLRVVTKRGTTVYVLLCYQTICHKNI